MSVFDCCSNLFEFKPPINGKERVNRAFYTRSIRDTNTLHLSVLWRQLTFIPLLSCHSVANRCNTTPWQLVWGRTAQHWQRTDKKSVFLPHLHTHKMTLHDMCTSFLDRLTSDKLSQHRTYIQCNTVTAYLRSNGPKTTQNEQKRCIFAPNGARKIHLFCSVFVIFGPSDLKQLVTSLKCT